MRVPPACVIRAAYGWAECLWGRRSLSRAPRPGPAAAMDRPLRPGAPLSHNAGAPGHVGPKGAVR
jgi:hypothetical protein